MASKPEFTLLYGSGEGSATCSLLKLGDLTILLDCGWDQNFDEELLKPLETHIDDIDLVLLSHGSLAHLGALPYAVRHLGLTAPIYGTDPVWQMGQMVLYDMFRSYHKYDDYKNLFTLDDVDTVFEDLFEKINTFGKNITIGEDVVLTPQPAGHSLGGTIWKIAKPIEEVCIYYAVDFNHARDAHLNGAKTAFEDMQRPTLVITDAAPFLTVRPPRKARLKSLTDTIGATLKQGGSVLLPVNTADRVLELAIVLHHYWVANKLHQRNYSLCFLSGQSSNVIQFAKGFPEWLSDQKLKELESNINVNNNPFHLPHLQCVSSIQQLERLSKPMVVLATGTAMNLGLALDVFLRGRFASNPKNLVLFTNKLTHQPTSLAAKLLQTPAPEFVSFTMLSNVDLVGRELDEFLEQKRVDDERAALYERNNYLEDDSDSEDIVMDGLGISSGRSQDKVTLRTSDGHHLKRMKLVATFPLFPYVEHIKKVDAYGEICDPSIFSDEVQTAADYKHAEAKEPEPEQEEAEPEEEATPQKTIKKEVKLRVKCSVSYIDMEGRSDGISVQQLLKRMLPKQLILIRGSRKAKEAYTAHALKAKACENVVSPAQNQVVDVTAETNVYRFTLSKSLVNHLNFVTVGDCSIAYADTKVSVDAASATLPVLNYNDKQQGHPAVFVGDLKFPELQKVLHSNGMQADFVGGILVCADGSVNVRKISKTQISIRGSLCPAYYQIRSLLYGEFEIV